MQLLKVTANEAGQRLDKLLANISTRPKRVFYIK